MNAKEIRELFQRHNLPLSKDGVWEVQGNPVIKHKELEKLAAAIGVKWHEPKILRAERDEAVILVSGWTVDHDSLEWSIGEAVVNQNYKVSGKMQPYVFAMAEKRGKDRCILKLAGLHGAYSEEEADDFKQRDQAPQPPPPQPPDSTPARVSPLDDDAAHREAYTQSFCARIKVLPRSEALDYAKSERRDVWREYGIDQNDEYGRRMAAVVREITQGAAA